MYNGVGLQTARGSGTSGYIQKNKSYLAPGQKPKTLINKQGDYGKILQQMKANPTPLPRPPNPEILKHEMLRKIEVEVYKKEKELKLKQTPADEMRESLEKLRKQLTDRLENSNSSKDVSKKSTPN